MIRKEGYVLWPAYFDVKNSRSQGRRVRSGLTVQRPTADDLLNACRRLGWSAVKMDGAYPSSWFLKTGYVVVKPPEGLTKNAVIQRVGEELRKIGKR
ncbi:MAG: signal recognition particle protein Srp19 [Candidatus Caldarchaeum sp.]|nr:signal recognition particle protein Srp19 [Candidatus Caldarchaeum sp.]MCS7137461.1 signal recognition particle protein Srp19 [Candidatus Caldarchaeum sp.]MDW7977810.1 signal recognition particle subunit SRP19/SEC65 family protein [Candidatus Caldarchaeum sp.]MDW8359990.1 signal recognition particle subunit SRP19/SEC65 family protein [Candidatus Caldarchaeum sp.]